MLIKIWSNYVALGDGWTPWDPFLHGSEEYIREVATNAAILGHEVIVYHNGGTHGEYKNVYYLPHETFSAECDTLLVVKDPAFLDQELSGAKQIIYHTNNVDDSTYLTPERVRKVTRITACSLWQKENLLTETPKVEVVPYGCYPDRYLGASKQPYLCLYASSPDRGLDHLLRAWPSIKEAVPQAELIATYDSSEEEIDELYRKAEFWLYPCTGWELFCITGLKCQAAGVLPVIVPHMALAETVKYGLKTDLETFTQTAIHALTERHKPWQKAERKAMTAHQWPTWMDVTRQTLGV